MFPIASSSSRCLFLNVFSCFFLFTKIFVNISALNMKAHDLFAIISVTISAFNMKVHDLSGNKLAKLRFWMQITSPISHLPSSTTSLQQTGMHEFHLGKTKEKFTAFFFSRESK